MVYRGAFVTGLALLLLAAGIGFYQSVRVEHRLPPLSAYSAIAGSIDDLVDEAGAEQRIDQLRLMLLLMPSQATSTHFALGRVLEAAGELEQAIFHFRQALAGEPLFAEAHHNLGVALARQGRLEEALAETREALRLKPDLPEARQNLPRMEARLEGAASSNSLPAEIQRGRAFARQFYRGEVEELHTHFNAEFARRMPLDAFVDLRRKAARQLGAETELLEESSGTLGASTLYVRRARFAEHDGEVEVVIQWGQDGSILGFMLRPATAGASSGTDRGSSPSDRRPG